MLFALVIAGCIEKPLEEGKYRINGTITGLENGEIYLSLFPKVDTIKVENGKFKIERELKEVVGRIYLLKDLNQRGMDGKRGVYFFIEPKIMTLNLNYEDFSDSKLEGSITQDDQYRLDAITGQIRKEFQPVLDKMAANRKLLDEAQKAKDEAEFKRLKYIDNDIRGEMMPMNNKISEASIKFVKENPKSFASVNAILFLLKDLKYEEAKAIADQFNPEHLKIEMGLRVAAELEEMKKGIPGAMAGNFDTVDINGIPIKLDDFKGKYLLIDFWASWCVPCRKGSPHIIDLFNKYNSKGLEVLGVASDDSTPDAWRKAVKEDKVGIFHQVLSGLKFDRKTMTEINPGIGDGYNISTLPTKILVGPDGIILGRFGTGGGNDTDMDKMLAEIFE